MKIMHTDNFGGDYPDEKFVEGLPCFGDHERGMAQAQLICNAINKVTGPDSARFYKVVADNYELQPGFEP